VGGGGQQTRWNVPGIVVTLLALIITTVLVLDKIEAAIKYHLEHGGVSNVLEI